MCVEVTERALAQTGKDEVILVGGVGANQRLQAMLRMMCEERGASFSVPEMRYIGDNGAMIAYTGRLMLEKGDIIEVRNSRVNPSYRADQVPISWRNEPTCSLVPCGVESGTCARGAEAVVMIEPARVMKRRVSKRYRHPSLDSRLIHERTRAEARLIAESRRYGIPTPVIQDITSDMIVMERIEGMRLRDSLSSQYLQKAGRIIGLLHGAGLIHGDLTTCNMIVRGGQCYLIDFGLGFTSSEIEARGVDIHVLFQVLESTAPDDPALKEAFIEGYRETFEGADDVLVREHEIDLRGRYL
jgi:N6-L-threonylcarbamoyladenine synthase/protein kinase Bud32